MTDTFMIMKMKMGYLDIAMSRLQSGWLVYTLLGMYLGS
jgi:hypothetical protein